MNRIFLLTLVACSSLHASKSDDPVELTLTVQDQRILNFTSHHHYSTEFRESTKSTTNQFNLGDLQVDYTVVEKTPENLKLKITMSGNPKNDKIVFARLDPATFLALQRHSNARQDLKKLPDVPKNQQEIAALNKTAKEKLATVMSFYQTIIATEVTVPWNTPTIIHQQEITTSDGLNTDETTVTICAQQIS
jgi:hypothetical protein